MTTNAKASLFLAVSLITTSALRSSAQQIRITESSVWVSPERRTSAGLAIGDVNGDGALDLVIGKANSVPPGNQLYLSTAAGVPGALSWSNPDEGARALALGDINQDGILDLACGNIGANTVYLGDGNTFEASPAWFSDSTLATWDVALGDVDNDGDLDLVCANLFDGAALYRNTGGRLETSPAWSLLTGQGPTVGIALGDVDGDGDIDLVCANGDPDPALGRNTLYLNNGGAFDTVAAWMSSTRRGTKFAALGDVNGDGALDLVCGNQYTTTDSSSQFNTLYLNVGGVFDTIPAWESPQSNDTRSVTLGDADGDGDLDLLCANFNQSNLLYENIGGSFSTLPAWTSNPAYPTWESAMADFEGDGDLDVVCANAALRGPVGVAFPEVIYRNDAAVFGTEPSWIAGDARATVSLAIGDLNGDGAPDLATGNSGGYFSTVHYNIADTLQDQPGWLAQSADYTYGVALGDVGGDGDIDIVHGAVREPNKYYENQSGTFSRLPAWLSRRNSNTYDIALGDIDGDGLIDLVCGNKAAGWPGSDDDATNAVYRGLISGGFSKDPVWVSTLANPTYAVALGDVDGDFDLDLVCGNHNQPNTLYLNTNGMFEPSPAWSSLPANDTEDIALGDVDGDGDLDLVCANSLAANTIYRNEGGVFETQPSWQGGVAQGVCMALGDVDGDGDLDAAFGNTVSWPEFTIHRNTGGVFELDPYWSIDGGDDKWARSVAFGDMDRDGDLDVVWGVSLGDNRNRMYSNKQFPAYKGSMSAPTRHLPNNGPSLRYVSHTVVTSINLIFVSFKAFDLESDPIYIFPEYQFEGSSQWLPVVTPGGSSRVGPFATSPIGEDGNLTWDILNMDFDTRDVILRLRIQEMPSRVALVQHAPGYRHKLGKVLPQRPVIETSADVIAFPAMSAGDTLVQFFSIGNAGTATLAVDAIDMPARTRTDTPVPASVAPGDSLQFAVWLEPDTALAPLTDIVVTSNDPFAPVRRIEVRTDVRALTVNTRVVTPEVLLGELVTVLVTPDPFVRLDGGVLKFFAPGGDTTTIPLSPTGDDFSVVIPREYVTEAGLRYFVEMWNSPVFATDPPNAQDSVYAIEVPPPDGFSSEALTTIGEGYLEGSPVDVQLALPPGALFKRGTLFYREGSGSDYSSVAVDGSGPVPTATIPDSVVASRGVEYWIELETDTRTLSDPPFDAASHPHAIPVTMTNLVEPRRHVGKVYRLFSIPLRMQGTMLGSVGDELGGADPTVWRMFAFDPATATYLSVPSSKAGLTSFAQGRAYWLIMRDAHQIGTGDDIGETARTDRAFEVTLAPGYNLVGNPYNFTVAWDSFLVDTVYVTDASVDTLLQKPIAWDGENYIYDVSVLEPFDGYWIENRSPSPVTLSIPPLEATADTASAIAQNPAPARDVVTGSTGWRAGISVSFGDTRNENATFGVDARAASRRDRFDRSLAPAPPGSHLSLYFPHEEWGNDAGTYIRDIRPRFDRNGAADDWGEAWHFDVAGSHSPGAAGDHVQLAFTRLGDVPDDASICLVDKDLRRKVDLRATADYAFHLRRRDIVKERSQTRFVLLVGSAQFVASEGQRLARPPTHTILHQNYPNPFNPSTVIRYDLSRSGRVRIHIYDARGARVHVLEDRARARGRYEVTWNGENDRGERVSSGVYFYRLSAPGFTRTRKMVLLK